MKILVTGATGYIGGRLIPKLLDAGHEVRVFVRDPRRLRGKQWAEDVEIAQGDLNNADEIKSAMDGIDTAYFLVHAMYSGDDYAEKEKRFAHNFAHAAKEIKKVIYLGGLLPEEETSEHLKSRAAVGKILRAHCRTTEFRAGPIIGSGSASFEMVRYLTERLPVMITPKWVENSVQPIAIRDVISYLVKAIEKEPLGVVDIGADVVPFIEMMRTFARVRGLKRVIIPVPVLTPWLSGLWVGLITPIPNSLAVPLVMGTINPVIADIQKAEKNFPGMSLMPYHEAVKEALKRTDERAVETRWSGSLGKLTSYKLTDSEGMLKEVRTVLTHASAHSVYKSFTGIGGEKGWLAWNWAWKLRGYFDALVGGPGLSRGRRHPADVHVGEVLDFWRVEELEEDRLMLLRAEMKVPGKAWLQFEAIKKGEDTQLVQTAMYVPKGFLGVAYWYAMYPAHLFLFGQMARNIAKAAEVYERNSDGEDMPATV
ncbi:MAG: SDR family oxidoreductase [Pyrinomonadaceae bacterium]